MTPEPHLAPRLTTPDPDEDQEDGGSEQSEGSSSGKENDGEPPTLWRGSRGSLTSRGSRWDFSSSFKKEESHLEILGLEVAA